MALAAASWVACHKAPDPAPPNAAHGGSGSARVDGHGSRHGGGHGDGPNGGRGQGHGHGRHGHDPANAKRHAHGTHGGHRFDDAAKWADVFDDPQRDAWQKPDHVVELLRIVAGMTVVDLGAGTGYFVGRLSKAVGDRGKVIATDVEPSMVMHLRERGHRDGWKNVEPSLATFDDPNVEANRVDRVLVVNVWHHLTERVAYGRKLAASLRRGGSVHVVDFTLESSHGPPKEMRLTAEQVAAELREAGLATRIVAEELPNQYVVEGRK